jgi:HK97 family phage major capsid protein
MSLSVYKLVSDFGELGKEGDVVHLDSDVAQPLVDAGILEEAQSEDMNGDGAAPEMEEAAVENAVKRLGQRSEAAIAKAAEKVASRMNTAAKRPSLGVPAQVKEPVFKCLGEMLKADYLMKTHHDVRSRNQLHAYQQEIRQKSPLGANETVGQGGYAIKPEWYGSIWDKVREYPKLLEMTDVQDIHSNSYNIVYMPETSLANGSRHGGVQSYWVSEGNTITSSYPATGQATETLNAQMILCYVTNQLLEDANIEPFQKYVERTVGLEVAWQHNDSVINGSGSGQPTGVLAQPSLITVAKSTNDGAAMFGFDDLTKMNRSLWEGCRRNAVWIINPQARATLESLVFVSQSGTATTYPAFGGVSFSAADEFQFRIFGMPVIFCLNNPQLGLPGDVILADLSQLITTQRPGLEAAVSTDVQFATYQTAYRFVRRYDIKSPWAAAVTSVDGHYSYSPFITLASRGT